MTFPFGGFQSPDKERVGHFSGATRDFRAEMDYDEGDPDPYETNCDLLADETARARFEACWHDKINAQHARYDAENLDVWALGQSHIDLAWLWRLYQTVNKAKITLGKAAWHVLHLPDFSFTFSQPVMLEWLRVAHPATFARVQEAVATGRFELQGGCWAETDAKLPAGEAFCRSRLHGQRYYMKHFGKLATIEWLPDSFGYNNNIPQFVRKSGGTDLFIMKCAGNWPPDAFPFCHFLWRAPDGSELLTYMPNFQFRVLTRWHIFGFNRRILKPGTSLECDYSHPDPASAPQLDGVFPVVMVPYGIGDGGHGPTSEEVHRVRYLVEQGHVERFTTARAYYDKLGTVADRLPVWNGAELYYNLHRGTLTTQALVKRMNRFFEWRLTAVESLLASLAFARVEDEDPVPSSQDANRARFERLWKDVVLLQFHDILPGSSVPEVYDDCYDLWQDMLEEVERAEADLLGRALGNARPAAEVAIVNGSSYGGKIPVEIVLPNGCGKGTPDSPVVLPELVTPGPSRTPTQHVAPDGLDEALVTRPGRLVALVDVSPWTILPARLVGADANAPAGTLNATTGPASPVSPTGPVTVVETDEHLTLETPETRLVVHVERGTIVRYHDKVSGRDVVVEASDDLQCFRDWAFTEPAWNLGPGYRECPLEPDEVETRPAVVVERGPVRWTVERGVHFPESNTTITRRVSVYPGCRGIFCEVVARWHQEDALVKDYFTLPFTPEVVVAEGPYTTELLVADPARRTHLDAQRWEACCHTWVAAPAPEDDWGVVLVNDSKYGFDVDKRRLGLSLLRGPAYPAPRGYVVKERAARAARGDPRPPTHTDQGDHIVRYAVRPYEGSWHAAEFTKFAHAFNWSVFATRLPAFDSPAFDTPASDTRPTDAPDPGVDSSPTKPCPLRVVTPDRPNLEITAMKLLEDPPAGSKRHILVRVVETGRVSTRGVLRLAPDLGVTRATLVDLLERPWTETPLHATIDEVTGHVVAFSAEWRPHEILTFLLEAE